jgi:hypothetical protein
MRDAKDRSEGNHDDTIFSIKLHITNNYTTPITTTTMRRFSAATATTLYAFCLLPTASYSLHLPVTKKSANPQHHPRPTKSSSSSSSSRNLISVPSITPSSSSLPFVESVVEQRVEESDSSSSSYQYTSFTILPLSSATTTASSLQKRVVPRLSEPQIWKLALAGSIATLVSDIAMHPMDCIKTLQQTEEGIGLSMIDAAHTIYHTMGGLTGFTRGFLTWGICDALGGALKFSTYEGLKRQIQQQIILSVGSGSGSSHQNDGSDDASSASPPPPHSNNNIVIFVLAAISFVASSIITVPGEVLKQHLQMGHYPGCFEALWTIVDTQGVTGLYTGYDGVLLRDTPYTALELGLYDVFKNLYLRRLKNKSMYHQDYENDAMTLQSSEQILIAGFTGGVAGLLTAPFDTIKTKATIDFVGCSFWDAAMLTIHDHGPEGLFCGAAARVAWLMPVTAIYLPLYDLIKTTIQEHPENIITVINWPPKTRSK